MMGDSKFLQSLFDYDKDNIKVEVIEKIRPYTTSPEFEPELIGKASKAAKGLCQWVRAMEVYDRVAKQVAPKRAALAAAEAEFAEVSELLRQKKESLAEVERKIGALQEQFEETNARKEELARQVEDCSNKLERAQTLIGGLGGERVRWGEASDGLGKILNNVTGDVLIASAVVSYLGPFTQAFRERIVARWIALCKAESLPCSASFSLTATLGDAVKIRAWNIDGLPNDSFSVDNGIITSYARRWPLMIDPQMQANRWIKQMHRALPSKKKGEPETGGLISFKLTDSDFLRSLENAVQFGKPALLENVGEELDPVLEPILLRQVFKSGGIMSIRLGDSTIEYNKDFRFYVTTKLRNPHYMPEVSVKVTLLNFMITPEGLQDQLLGIVVAKERPELQREKDQLVLEAADNKRQLKEIEDKILKVLSESEGNILDDQTAIDILSASKRLSDEIAQKQDIAEETTARLDKTREGYQPAAFRASLLFFAISDMANVDPMYQYSLQWYIALFEKAIDEARQPREGLPPHEALAQRLELLMEQNTISCYRNVCRSLYENAKLLFSFLMCVKILQSNGSLDEAPWRFFLTGGAGLLPEDAPANPSDGWLSTRAWEELQRLAWLPGFEALTASIARSVGAWRALYDSAEPHLTPLPGAWEEQLSDFEKMCVRRCLRPDKVLPMVSEFVSQHLGQPYIEPPPFSLEDCYADSSNVSPLVFVLSPGQDPMAQLLKFAEQKGMAKNVKAISLGQGQGPIAHRLIVDGINTGGWVVLQNCHLSTSWMPTLEKICEDITPERANVAFRLWLTSAPSKDFPVSILQNGVKMTNEPPKGLKANLLGSYLADPISDPDFFDGVAGPNGGAWKPLLFGLTFFHAVIQERRQFGPLGWNIPYEFNESDLRISVRQLRLFLETYDHVPFAALRYCTGEANYGGRVTDDKDRMCMAALLADPYSAEGIRPGYVFSPDGVYRQPGRDVSTHADYLGYIRALPAAQSPQIFGLHENASITKDLKETRELFEATLSTQATATGGGAGGSSQDELLQRIAEDISAKLPAEYDVDAAQAQFPVTYLESMNTVLVQELIRFNRLTAIVRTSLGQIQKAIKGIVVMNADLEALGQALLQGARPALWMKRSYPSLKPLGAYVSDLLTRLAFFTGWLENGAPQDFWLPGFFFTQAFLTGSMQNYARRNQIAIDRLGFQYEVMRPLPAGETRAAPSEGVHVHGLFLEGARFSEQTGLLAESENKVLFVSLPEMWLRPQRLEDIAEWPHYQCPLYKTSERKGTLSTTGHSTNFVMFLKLPSDRPAAHWVRRGLAALCQLDD
eukprot:scaffold47683_cov66-Phaeocystis_antarctica.AAC.1